MSQVDERRLRIMQGLIAAAGKRRLERLTVGDVLKTVGISRRTFYLTFPTLADAAQATFDHCAFIATGMIDAHWHDRLTWSARVRACLTNLLDLFDAEPDLANFLLVETLGLGSWSDRRNELWRQLVEAFSEAAPEPLVGDDPRLIAEGTIGSILAILSGRCSERSLGDAGRLSDLASELMAVIVFPYLGATASGREFSRV